ncbi:MAG: quinone oxidoreductase [Pseudonocardiales bacterium]|nr:quinone oxidoreductase [Pseudonocardiales bacterium]MBV9029060.1 quinone oxidoreductase [Pseudonocardiales bacterium]MBW0009975.1 quinone oxidoreductase [Pseudonocardiales bacterium]
MRAIQITETGGPEVLRLAELPEPEPGPGRLLVEVAAAGVNYIDIYHRSGAYPMPLPFTPGTEGAGTVTAVGLDVSGFTAGDRVAWVTSPGSYAELAVVPAEQAVPVPPTVGSETAASCLLQGMTAHCLTVSVHSVQPGETVLVHAAAGGMGLLLTQLATARGARVIGTVSTAGKERLARESGAAEVIRYTEVDDLASEVRGLTGGDGVAAVYDGVGASTFDASLASLRPRGMLALYGAASGPVPPVDPQRLGSAGSVFLTRPTLGHYVATREELLWRAGEVFDSILDGSLRITIGGRYPLADAGRAHQDLQGRRTTGKLLLLPR